ncbi:MAG: type II toxin-antitoxin system RelE/ParE family toxin [Planctomycetales bacterium]
MAEVVIAAAAEDDFAESLRWYAERSMRAAEGFQAEFQRALESIATNPDRFPSCDNRHRYCLLKPYPFHVIFRELSRDQCLVVAVAHTSRRPGYWSIR